MKKIILAIMVLAVSGCVNTQDDVSVIAWKIVARRVGSMIAISSPELAEATRAPAEAVLTSEDTQAVMVAFGNALLAVSETVDDPLLAADIVDLSSIFIGDEYSWGDKYIDIAQILVIEYITGLG